MKTTTLILLVLLTGLGLRAQMPPGPRLVPQRPGIPAVNPADNPMPQPGLPSTPAASQTVAPATATSAAAQEMVPAGDINFQGVDVDQVLDVYARYVGRTLLRAGLPQAKIVLYTETPLTKDEVVQALQGVLALNGIALINIGDKFVKAVPVAQASQEGAAFNTNDAAQLPDVGQYVTHIVQLKYIKPSELAPVLQQFAKIPNGVFPIDSNGILILRDYAENIKRMLEFISQVDVIMPEEFISEVIPIKYAMVDDIANALNSLGGSSSAIGNATTPSSRGGAFGNMGGTGNQYQNGGGNQSGGQITRPFGTAAGGAAGGGTFSQRLQSIIQRAASGGGQGEIQLLGPTKIIADERSNSLLVYATKEDMKTIKDIVAKLDVLLPQVLIESVIMDVNLNNGWNFGVSVAQNPKTFSPTQGIQGAGGYNNGQSFFDFMNNTLGTNATSTASTAFGNSLGSGLSYFGNIGPTWDVALAAAASDSSVSIIQRPRIQTFQAKEAQFFVGETVPYVTSVYYNSGIGGGPSSSYSQLQVGISLDVTPFINPNGLVVMDISQEIDDLNGSTFIQGVGNVPNTDKRQLSSEVAVKDRDTIILGGFIRTEKDKSKNGVPLLQDIPILGSLFSSRTSNHTREELLVLMRPTVLKTPEVAAVQTTEEEKRLPGISAALANEETEQRQAEQAEQRRERMHAAPPDSSYQPVPQGDLVDTNAVSLPDSGTSAKNAAPPFQAQPMPGRPQSAAPSSGSGLFQPLSPEGYVNTNAVPYPGR
ncbi:MAG TPA: secretin N-terminal domain-containing protein [Candidatus Sulfopaludibacter sp.]|nr:secretin N-terminal domain-containing protein [Candidatus Sulfopaludibacter sp.]